MLTKIENIKETVKELLLQFPETRDNDNKLLLKVWCLQNPRLRTDHSFAFFLFGNDFANGLYADPESVRRTRQKLQEAYPNLRGEKYKMKMQHADYVRKEIKN